MISNYRQNFDIRMWDYLLKLITEITPRVMFEGKR